MVARLEWPESDRDRDDVACEEQRREAHEQGVHCEPERTAIFSPFEVSSEPK